MRSGKSSSPSMSSRRSIRRSTRRCSTTSPAVRRRSPTRWCEFSVRLDRFGAARPAAASLALADGFLRCGQLHHAAQVSVVGTLVRNRHGLNEVMLEARLDGGLHLFDAPDQRFDGRPAGRLEQRDAGTGAGGIARGAHLAQVAVRNHAEDGRVLDVDVTAECARQADAIHMIDAEAFHQQYDAGIEGRLRELNGAHVGLRDLELECADSAPSTTPSWLMMPARYISAITSMMPEPHTPVMPVAAVASSKPRSSDHRSEPMSLKRGSSVSRSMRTRSIAPGAARCD